MSQGCCRVCVTELKHSIALTSLYKRLTMYGTVPDRWHWRQSKRWKYVKLFNKKIINLWSGNILPIFCLYFTQLDVCNHEKMDLEVTNPCTHSTCTPLLRMSKIKLLPLNVKPCTMSRRGSEGHLFIGRLSKNTQTRHLEDIFEPYGRLTRCDIKYGWLSIPLFFSSKCDSFSSKNKDGRPLFSCAFLV